MNTRIVFIQALSPIHCGTGQAVGGIDLPIAREKPTNVPFIPGSSFKGVLRAAGDTTSPLQVPAFGPKTDDAHERAGSVQFSDVNLVFLPVRSVKGTFAYVTSPYLLRRLQRDLKEAQQPDLPRLGKEPGDKTAIVTGARLQIKVGAESKVVFEDLDFTAVVEGAALAQKLAQLMLPADEHAAFVERFCVVNDDIMSLLLETCTEITARNRLDEETKTVAKGALWTEEALPVETILAGLLVATPVMFNGKAESPKALLDYVAGLTRERAIQVGGKATVGRGLCRVKVVG